MLKEFIQSRTGLPLVSVKEQTNTYLQQKIKEDEREERENVKWLSENMIPRSIDNSSRRLFPTDMILHLFTPSQDVAIIPIWKDFNSRGVAATHLTGTGYDQTAFAKGYLNDLYFFLTTDQRAETGVLNIAKTNPMLGSPLVATIQPLTVEGSPILNSTERAIDIPKNDKCHGSPKDALTRHLKDHIPGNPEPLNSFIQKKIIVENLHIEDLPAYFSLNMSRSHRNEEIDPLKIAIRLAPSIWDNYATMTSLMRKYYGEKGIK